MVRRCFVFVFTKRRSSADAGGHRRRNVNNPKRIVVAKEKPSRSYAERLLEWTKEHNEGATTRSSPTRAIIISLKEDILSAIKGGHDVKAIWRHMFAEGMVHCQYRTFVSHVNKEILQEHRLEDKAKPKPAKNAKSKPMNQTKKKFDHDPTPDKGKLVG